MNIDRVNSGDNIPHEINVVIEIPALSDPVKYEVDKKTGAMFVDRFMGTAMHYPANYGYIPHSLAEDGDPLDVLVITPLPLISGSVIRCRPVSLLAMTDDSGPDPKVIAVPLDDMTILYKQVQDYDDLRKDLTQQIEHFYKHYKDLEENKWVKIEGWKDRAAACAEILASIERFDRAPVKPLF